jgi:cytochrome P450
MKKWHEQYGPVVRIGPNRLSFDGEIGWPAIFGHRKPGQPEYEKSPSVFGEKRHLLVASKEVHRRQRRQLAHAFSDASLVQQEPTVNKYVDMLMEYLTTQAQSGEALDIVKWFNFTTFDIIGDLAFTESFRSLESRSYNPWVLAIFQGIRGGALLRMFYNYPFGNLIVKLIKLSPKVRTLSEIRSHARNKAIARMEYGAERMEGHKDFTTYMMKTNRDGEPGMDREEILQNAPTIVIAGSETTATSLSGFCFYVRQNPNVYDTLASEIRSAFSSDADISMTSTAALQYLAAVINETLRVYPPVATTPERHSPGGVIDGQYIPADISQFSAEIAYFEEAVLTYVGTDSRLYIAMVHFP